MKHIKSFFIIAFLIIQQFVTFAQTNPIMYFPFNGNTIDESGNNNNATNFGATLTTDRFENENSAYYFDGINDFMEIVPISDLSAVGDFTISIWIKFDSWTYPSNSKESNTNLEEAKYIFNGHARLSTASSDFFREGFNIIANRDIYDNEYINTGTVYTYSPITSYRTVNEFTNINNWKLIVYTRKNGVFTTYINDAIATISFTNGSIAINKTIDMMHNIYIGTFSGNNPNFIFSGECNYMGKIDDIRLYNRALSDQEISRLYYENNSTPINITGTTQNESRFGKNDGQINTVITGGIEPYTFNWSNGKTTQNISNLSANTYTLTVTDKIGQFTTKDFQIFQEFPLDTLSISGIITTSNIPIAQTKVILYKKNDNSFTYIKEITTDSDGSYSFNDLLEGNYIIFAIPYQELLSSFCPTYYNNATSYKNSNTIDLKGIVYHVNIDLLPTKTFTFNGLCSIHGTITFYSESINSRLCIVSLYQNNQIIESTLCSENGEYSFINLPIGDYEVKTEYVGYNECSANIHLDSYNTCDETINFSPFETLLNEINTSDISIFPNPATKTIFFSNICNATLYNVYGDKLLEKNNISKIDISTFPNGIYIVKIQLDNKTEYQRIVIEK